MPWTTDSKNAKGVDTSSFAEKNALANLKSDVDNLSIDKLKNVPSNLSNLKRKVDKLAVDNLVPGPVDLIKISDAVVNHVVKKDVDNAKIKNIEDERPDITNSATNTTLNAKVNEVKSKVSNITNVATTTALTAVIVIRNGYSIEGSLDRILFSAELKFPKTLVHRLHQMYKLNMLESQYVQNNCIIYMSPASWSTDIF